VGPEGKQVDQDFFNKPFFLQCQLMGFSWLKYHHFLEYYCHDSGKIVSDIYKVLRPVDILWILKLLSRFCVCLIFYTAILAAGGVTNILITSSYPLVIHPMSETQKNLVVSTFQ